MDQPVTHLAPATDRRTREPRVDREPAPRRRMRRREDLVTFGLACAALALSGLWIIGLVTVVRWVV